ncbi:hypothetical protein O1611_g7646 [Lasiodiplodia mahajangana]|uniref:Uncharacterized protein n=1 Tax=Lasiodiplodia mahajangana TaxID=1108764 RepID=A0ACC2JEN6_9PEZI|nr:hypothetical protein O1611_g7646 [Lasiodiplodia mahajangana]
MREDLKGQNLTFTEIAKLVGENWQNLGRAEKEPFERQANEAKEKYNQDLAEYKKTPECIKYNEYLRDFRKRQAAQTQEKDAAKRLKTDAESTRGSSTSGGSIGPGGTTSGNGSGSESQHGSEPPPSRQQRLGSIASMSTGISLVDDSLASPTLLAQEESHFGRRRGLSSPHLRDASIHSTSHRNGWPDGQYVPGDPPSSSVPWLDPRTAPPTISQSPESSVLGIHPGHPGQGSHAHRLSRGSGSSGVSSLSQPPSLKHEQSSHGSISSKSSQPPRTPSDASLPIHALLSSRPELPAPSYVQAPPLPPPSMINGQTSQVPLPLGNFHGSPIFSNNNPSTTPGLAHENVANSPQGPSSAWMSKQAGNGENGLDGITALLRAREIVDRRP